MPSILTEIVAHVYVENTTPEIFNGYFRQAYPGVSQIRDCGGFCDGLAPALMAFHQLIYCATGW